MKQLATSRFTSRAVTRHRRRPNDHEHLTKPPFTPFGCIENGPDEGALIFERQADPKRLLDPPLRRASLLSNAEVARLMALSHMGVIIGQEGGSRRLLILWVLSAWLRSAKICPAPK